MSLLSLRNPRRFRPTVEALEERQVMSCTIDLSVPGTLTINGATNSKNKIDITDTGTTAANAIVVSCEGVIVGTFSGASFTTIVVNGGKKNDNVTYTVGNGIQTTSRTIGAFLGDGNDTFTANLNASIVGAGVTQGVIAFGGNGNDKLKVNANNGALYGAGAGIGVILQGGAGNDDVSFNFSGSALVPTVTLLFLLDGGAGNDRVSASLSLNSLGFHVTGFPSPFTTPPGGPAAQVNGSDGNDKLNFSIQGNPPDATSFGVLDGGPGKDKCTVSGFNVIAVNCES
jgi:hypothetical protein